MSRKTCTCIIIIIIIIIKVALQSVYKFAAEIRIFLQDTTQDMLQRSKPMALICLELATFEEFATAVRQTVPDHSVF